MRKTRTRLIEREREQERERVRNANANHEKRLSKKQSVKLPKLVIDKLTGEISKWQEFWSHYAAAIHSNEALCKKEKFAYLKTYLAEAAATAVPALTLTDSSYDAAIELMNRTDSEGRILLSVLTCLNCLI